MKTEKRTYALPARTLQRFKQEIAPGKRSTKVAELIENWIGQREREAFRQFIIEGCCEMREIYLEVANEWKGADDELWRNLEPSPQRGDILCVRLDPIEGSEQGEE